MGKKRGGRGFTNKLELRKANERVEHSLPIPCTYTLAFYSKKWQKRAKVTSLREGEEDRVSDGVIEKRGK